ncbi:PEP-CTERM sorting domain-containing protein [Massilia aquatica]|uniref:PEP-CTERM sorting domain-containing protein n=1 Tax=Massilia aquatica TaxID=2609000 RepID=A0ABX0M3Y6_9BURK|nr:PEP-CTERM sorting domain-containing protein [Massilia aquatica]NHZ39753.1 PEP-CTERM sorting domain-containing protein [Massilia aquatica]
MKYITWTRHLAALLLAPGLAGAAPALIESPALNNVSKRYASQGGIELADVRASRGLAEVTRAMHLRPGDVLGENEHDIAAALGVVANSNLGSWSTPTLRQAYPDARTSFDKQPRSAFDTAGTRASVSSQSVPEPETYIMLAVGVAVIVLTRGTRKRLQDSLDA